MKKENTLIALLLLLFVSACRHDQLDLNALINASHAIEKTKEIDDNLTERVNVGKTYVVNSVWAPAVWTRKGSFNNDGYWDIISVDLAFSRAIVKLSNGEFNRAYTTQFWPIDNQWSNDAGYMFSGDFTGDGFTDLASANVNDVYMKINNGSGFSYATWPVLFGWGPANRTVVGDFDGNGKDDIASISGTTTFMKLSNGAGFSSANWTTDGVYGGGGWTFATDYNGDGRDDLVSVNGTQLLIKQSTGTSFINLVHTTTNTWGSVNFTWSGDTNHNGIGEIITAINNSIYVREWAGGSTWNFTITPTANTWGANGFNFVEDFNNSDGDDIVSCMSNIIYVH